MGGNLVGATICHADFDHDLRTPHVQVRISLLAYNGYCILERSTSQSPQIKPWIRKWQNTLGSLWLIKWTAEYFSTKLIKTVDLDPSHPYIFAYHPHGVISMGANLALSTNGCEFTKVFPGIQRSVVTLNVAFYIPFYRHWMLWLGCCSANKETLKGRLSQGESLVLIPGGAAEALYAHPQSFCLALSQRMGFLKLAQETNAKVIPVLGFGENDLFETMYHPRDSTEKAWYQSIVWKIQRFLYKHLTFSTPVWFHFFPKNKVPLNVVVGAPVDFPDGASVAECHSLYLKAIEKLYQDHQNQYGYKNVPLIFV